MLRFFYLTFCLLMVVACQQNGTTPTSVPTPEATSAQPEPETNWQLNTSEGLNIHHPEDWEVDLSGKNGSKFLLYFPEVAGEDFREFVILTAQDLPDNTGSLAAIGKICADQIAKLNEKTRVSMQQISPEGNFYELAYVGPQGNRELMNYQRVYLAGKTIYQLTYTGDAADFSNKLPVARAAMDTFTFPAG